MTSVSFAAETESKTVEATPVKTEEVKKAKKVEGNCLGYITSCGETGVICSSSLAKAYEEYFDKEDKC